MEAIFLQVLNGLDKGGAYALIALGLTLVFGTLGVVNFAHGALFMLGAFCAVSTQALLTVSKKVRDESITVFEAYKEIPYLEIWWGDTGRAIIDWAVPISILVAIPVMLLIGLVMAACAPQAEEPQEVPQIDLAAEEQAVRDINVRWLAMANEKNTTGIAALFMADGRVLSTTTEPAVGQAAIQASMDEDNAANPSRVSDWSADRVLVAASGDLAVEFGSYSSTGGGADGTVEDWGKYVTVLRKVGGEWKIDTDSAYSTKPESTNEASSQ